MHFGIDYGSNMAGSTAICFDKGNQLIFIKSEKKKKADDMITNSIINLSPDHVFIDAPLTIPSAYYGKGNDFHYRSCDRETKAMSPMFLGGLTARAMTLKDKNAKTPFFETYPAQLMRIFDPQKEFYLKKQKLTEKSLVFLNSLLELKLERNPSDWHEYDAVLAWISGNRYLKGTAQKFGTKDEGYIFV